MELRTKSGKILPKSKVKKISGEYYEVGDINKKDSGECYKINGKYYRASTGYLIFNDEEQQYQIKNLNEHVINGVIDITYEGKLILGNFNKKESIFKILLIDENNITREVINEDVFKNTNKYFLNINDNKYYHYTIFNNYDSFPCSVSNDYKYSLNYSATDSYISKYSSVYNKYNYEEIEDKFKILEPTINKLTFGVEIETIKGILTESDCLKTGLMPLRDGSISGIEYATIPMEGVKGISYLYKALDVLNKKTEIDDSCSIHFHIGNIPRTESFILALFKTLFITQDNFFDLFPLYIKEDLGVKRKHYTKPFSTKEFLKLDQKIDSNNITSNFESLFNYLSGGINYINYDKNLNNIINHPADPDNNRKWNISSR